MTVTGPDFVGLQVRDVAASADFYERHLGLQRSPGGQPGAVVFRTTPIPFAVREPLPGTDLDAAFPRPGLGVALWFRATDAAALAEQLAADGVPIVRPIEPGPFGAHFAFADPDGYVVTVHGG
jgi:catechol 2,3-dioxygenase-like lactoylglutathione lyase family enzyme